MPPKSPKTTDRPVPLKTVKDVAREDNVSEKTVRRAITAGLLEVIRVGPGGRLIPMKRVRTPTSPPSFSFS